jgi:hypothetical protein
MICVTRLAHAEIKAPATDGRKLPQRDQSAMRISFTHVPPNPPSCPPDVAPERVRQSRDTGCAATFRAANSASRPSQSLRHTGRNHKRSGATVPSKQYTSYGNGESLPRRCTTFGVFSVCRGG